MKAPDSHPDNPAGLLGSMVGQRYQVNRLLGQGSIGAVYEVKDTTQHRAAAMKVLLPDLAKTGGAAARFEREGKTLSVLAHRNIVEIVDCGRLENGDRFIVTDLIRGVSLRELIDEGWVEPSRALSIVRQILEALAHAHALGVVHRDIKPENIMLADGGDPASGSDFVKVLDFGVAKLLGDTQAVLGEASLTRTGFNVIGAPLYMAPEPLLDQPIDGRTDLYSVGVILFELLTGRTPFADPNPVVLAQQHAVAPIPTLAATEPDRTFGPQLELVVAEALQKKPHRRFASAAEMITAVDAALASLRPEPTVQCAAPPIPRASATATTQPARRRLEAVKTFFTRAARRVRPALSGLVAGARRWMSRLVAFLRRGGRRRVIAAAAALASLVLVVIAVTCSGGSPAERLAAGASATRELVETGDAAMTRGRYLDAVAAYERALAIDPLAASPHVRSQLVKIVTTRDSAAAVIALDVLAGDRLLDARDEIAAQATANQNAPVRHRAFAIAERDGFADRVDRVASWSLDLSQAKTCEDKLAVVAKLRGTSDRRAIAPLRRAKAKATCIKRDAAEAIAHLEASP